MAQSVITVGGEIDLIAARRKRIDELTGRLAVILNDENATAPSWHGLISKLVPTASEPKVIVAPSECRKLTFLSETVSLVIEHAGTPT